MHPFKRFIDRRYGFFIIKFDYTALHRQTIQSILTLHKLFISISILQHYFSSSQTMLKSHSHNFHLYHTHLKPLEGGEDRFRKMITACCVLFLLAAKAMVSEDMGVSWEGRGGGRESQYLSFIQDNFAGARILNPSHLGCFPTSTFHEATSLNSDGFTFE